MKPPVFIDTGYILALLNTSDEHHERATAASRQVKPPFLTTEAVLTEIGNALGRARWRAQGYATIQDLRADPNIEVVPVDSALFERALGYATIQDLRADPNIEVVPVDAALFERALVLYGARMDKEWGLTDCVSFVVMQERHLMQALTTDRHFGQAGFTDLLASFPAGT